jgi:hypothetical protein
MRLFSYARYLNQKGLDETYTDSFGTTKTVAKREDIQLTKFFLPFAGWFMTPKFRYYLYVWSSQRLAGRPGTGGRRRQSEHRVQQVRDSRARHHQPSGVRSTEGQFPYWLGVDDRLTPTSSSARRTPPASGSRAICRAGSSTRPCSATTSARSA